MEIADVVIGVLMLMWVSWFVSGIGVKTKWRNL